LLDEPAGIYYYFSEIIGIARASHERRPAWLFLSAAENDRPERKSG
jgi:hypothetical protein